MDCVQVSAASFSYLAKKSKKRNVEVFSASLADIQKALTRKAKTDPRTKLPEWCKDFLDVFSPAEGEKLPPLRGQGVDHQIELEAVEGKEPTVPWGPLYNMSRDELLVLRKTLTELLDKGFIRVSHSPAAAPVLFVRKPSGGLRFCVDYRGLNKLTKKDRYPLPLIYETLRNIGKAKWFTKLDVAAAFHKIRIAEGEEWKTAFRTRYGLYEWLVTPFGLANAPSTFQKYINWALRDFLDEFCSAYVDDILVYSSGSRKEHREHVRKVLQRMKEAGLQLDIDKCEFEVKSTKYLGFIIEAGKGVSMDPAKVEAILSWEAPKSVKGVRSFLGFANFYRRFIREFSEIVRPLSDLTHKDRVFSWTDRAETAFQKLKKMFISAPILVQFDYDRETILETDSSGWSVGGVLMQVDEEGVLRPCAFFSKKNNPAECNYEIYDKEMLAIIRCLEEWDAELRSVRQFEVRTDHKNLEYFMTARKLTERQMRWSLILSRYNFKISYVPGKDNERADALSRREQDLPTGEEDERQQSRTLQLLKPETLNDLPKDTILVAPVRVRRQTKEKPVPVSEPGLEDQDRERRGKGRDKVRVSEEQETLPEPGSRSQSPGKDRPSRGHAGQRAENRTQDELKKLWQDAQEGDEPYQAMVEAIQEEKRVFPSSLKIKVSIGECSLSQSGQLLFRGRRWVPDSEELRTELIQQTHDSIQCGHPGRDITGALLSRQFFWPNMSRQVRQFVRNCDACGRNKAWRDRRQGFLKPLPVPSRIWQEISIDFIVELPLSEGCTDMMVITDRLGKGVMLEAMRDITAETVAKWFAKTYYRQHGLPRAIVSDRGKQFVGALWGRVCKLLGITRRLSTAYHPETDGSTERMNQTIETFLRTFVDYDQANWAGLLPHAELAINNRDATSTGVSPFFLSHGYHVEPVQLQDEVSEEGGGVSPIQTADDIVRKLRDAREYAQAVMATAQQLQEEVTNRKRDQAPEFKVGDKVWLNLQNIRTDRPTKKLDAKYAKYTVVEAIGSHSFRLDTPPGIHDVFHSKLLRLAATDPLPCQSQDDSQPQPQLVGDEDEYEIEQILDEKHVRRGRGISRKLLVKWKGYARSTWEPRSALEETSALEAWEESVRQKEVLPTYLRGQRSRVRRGVM